MGVWLEGKPPADRVREFVKSEARRLREATGAVPGLTAVLVGDNKSSLSYVRTKEKACQALGLNGSVIHLPAETTMDALHDRIRALNDDDAVDGILVQLPLPPQLRTNEVIGWIRPDKDVDGIHPASLGLLLQNQPGLRPCTPMGVLELIRETGAAIEGRDAGVHSNVIIPAAVTRMSAGIDTSQFPPMDPDMVAPVVAWLSHESCAVSGEMLVSAAGRVARAWVAESRGVYRPQWTIEDVAANAEAIRDTSAPEHFTPVPDGQLDHLLYSFAMARGG